MRWLDRLLLLAAALVVVASVLPLGARLSLDARAHDAFQSSIPRRHGRAARARWRCGVGGARAPCSSRPAPSAPRRVLPYVPLPFAAERQRRRGSAAQGADASTCRTGQFSARRLLEIVREADPDVVVVQELTPHAESVLADFDTAFPHHRKFPADGPYGIGVLVALRARVGSERSRSAACRRSKRDVRGPTGAFTVIGVHLSAPTIAAARRRAQSRAASSSRRAARAVVGPARRRRRLQRDAVFAVLRRVARGERAHGLAPRPHAQRAAGRRRCRGSASPSIMWP